MQLQKLFLISSAYLDDEDSDGTVMQAMNRDKRREAHTYAEQKRRDAIKVSFCRSIFWVESSQSTIAMFFRVGAEMSFVVYQNCF